MLFFSTARVNGINMAGACHQTGPAYAQSTSFARVVPMATYSTAHDRCSLLLRNSPVMMETLYTLA